MSPSAYRRACACLLALLVTPTAGFASAFAASGAAASSAAGSDASHVVVAKHKKKRSKKTAVCSKRSKRARVKARKSSLTVPVPGVTTVTVPLPTLPPGGTTTTPGGTTTTPGGTTTTPGGTTTTPSGSGGGGSTGGSGGGTTTSGGGTTTTGSRPGTTTTGTTRPGSSSTSGTSNPAVTPGSGSSATSGSSTPSSTTKAKAKKKKARKHKKARHHAKKKKHAKKHAKKKVSKKKQPTVVKKHTTKKHGKKVTKKKVVKKKKSTKKHSTKKKVVKKKKSTKKKRKSTTQAPTQAPTQQCTPAAAPAPLPAPKGFTVGMVAGPAAAWEAGMTDAANLHPKVVRVPFQIGASTSSVQNQVAGLASKGEQALLLAEFPGRIPSTSEAQSLANWAKAVGPGGSFWAGRSDGALAVRYIEFGNETNQSYQFGGVSSGSSYIARAQSYAQRARDAADAIRAANPNVGLVAQADNGGSGTSQWVDGMFSAVPDLNKHVAGWTAHPYGPKGRYGPIMDKAMSDTARHGDTTLPFFITEYGISTNNGACLDSNYSWPNCMTYQQAGDGLRGAISDIRQRYPRVAQFFIFEQRDMANNPSGREANFGAVKSNGATKGAFTDAIRELINTYRG